MNIYDVEFNGAYFPGIGGQSMVKMGRSFNEQLDKNLSANVRFIARVLKEYKGKENVLQLKFKDGDEEYETLYEPGMYYEDGAWKTTKLRKASEAFLEEYKRICTETEEDTNIFNLIFYGVIENKDTENKKIVITLDKAGSKLESKDILFKAKILKQYRRQSYVIKLEREDKKCEYMSLFNAKVRYSETVGKWVECKESPIPCRILKCYVKHLSE